MLRKINRKLRKDRAGESIAETLVATLIATVALMMLAAMLNGSAQIITKSRKTVGEYYTGNNLLEEKGEGASGSFEMVLTDVDGVVRDETFSVVSYENRIIGSRPVISYRPGEQD